MNDPIYRDVIVVEAVRMALDAGEDDAAKLAVIEALVGLAPRAEHWAAEASHALHKAMAVSGAKFVVSGAR